MSNKEQKIACRIVEPAVFEFIDSLSKEFKNKTTVLNSIFNMLYLIFYNIQLDDTASSIKHERLRATNALKFRYIVANGHTDEFINFIVDYFTNRKKIKKD
jgi:hypothetical protein